MASNVRFVTEGRGSSGGRGGPRKVIPRNPAQRAQPSTPPPAAPRAPIRPVSPTNLPRYGPRTTAAPRGTIPFGPSAGAPRATPAPPRPTAPQVRVSTPAPRVAAPAPRVAAPPPRTAPRITTPTAPTRAPAPTRTIDNGAIAVPFTPTPSAPVDQARTSGRTVGGGSFGQPAPAQVSTGSIGGMQPQFRRSYSTAKNLKSQADPYSGMTRYEREQLGLVNQGNALPAEPRSIRGPSTENYRAAMIRQLAQQGIRGANQIIPEAAAGFPAWTKQNAWPTLQSPSGTYQMPTQEAAYAMDKARGELGSAGQNITGMPQSTINARAAMSNPVPIPRPGATIPGSLYRG
jgi:hypothetical protein